MGLRPEHVVQFDVYSLFCHHMADRLEPLRSACDESPISFNTCVGRFDEAIKRLFESGASVKSTGIDLVRRNLDTAVEDIRTQNCAAADVIRTAVECSLDSHSSWSYLDALEDCHQKGRQLAEMFFEKSHWETTKQNLRRRATLDFRFGRKHTGQSLQALRQRPPSLELDELIRQVIKNETRETKNIYQYLPGALSTSLVGDAYSISVPLAPSNNLKLYVSYPFQFMHEYTAHIFSNDYGENDRFNDGWMLYAADHYLVQNWPREGSRLKFINRAQAYAFREHLLSTLSDESREHYNYALEFYYHLLPWAPERFESITFELAAYEPKSEEAEAWPTRVLRRLADDVQTGASLKVRMTEAGTLEKLYPLNTELPPAPVV